MKFSVYGWKMYCILYYTAYDGISWCHTKRFRRNCQPARVTKGVEVAVLLYETAPHEYKVSLRASGDVDVSRIAQYFGGGGHKKAAGVTMKGTVHDVINNLSGQIHLQL